MNIAVKDMDKILEHLALQSSGDMASKGMNHGSTICRLPLKSWQAEILRSMKEMPQAMNPMELRRLMQNPDMPVIFVPHDAMVTRDIIDRI